RPTRNTPKEVPVFRVVRGQTICPPTQPALAAERKASATGGSRHWLTKTLCALRLPPVGSTLWIGRVNPRLTDSLILKLRLVFRFVESLVPSVSDNIPICITAEQIKLLRVSRLTNCQTGHRPHKFTTHNLPCLAGEAVPVINLRIANHSITSNLVRRWLH